MAGEPHADVAIAAALARLDAVDPAAATDARVALEWLVGDNGLEGLSRLALQRFCWYELPFKWLVAPVVCREVMVALARFFDLAGLARYAELCRSPATATVLEAWADDPSAGYEAYRRASVASGVEPPDLDELRWGTSMGPEELDAFWSTAMALEVALDAGELHPGERRFLDEQQAVARRHLTRPQPERLGESLLQQVLTARLAEWVDGPPGVRASRARAHLLAPVAKALLHPPAPPRGAGRSMQPMTWLLDRVDADGAGTMLTLRGNLPRAMVRDAVEAFPGWWRPAAPGDEPQREHDVVRLALVHDLARELRLLRRSGRQLTLSRRGQAARQDPVALWVRLAEHTCGGTGFPAAVAELGFALLLVEPLVSVSALTAEVTVALTEGGWYDDASDEPVPLDAVGAAIEQFAWTATTFGWAREKGRSAGRQLRLTEAGRAAALTGLRRRALGARGTT